jgi:periplasmic protein TorT
MKANDHHFAWRQWQAGTIFRFALLWYSYVASLFLPCSITYAQDLTVNSYYGQYDASRKKPGFPSESLTGPQTEQWITTLPARQYHIGVLLPHLNDSYWETANFGIINHGRKLGLRITVYLAGAYTDLGNQRSQLANLVSQDQTDGVILASVDYKKMDPFVAEAEKAGVPVVALINDIYAPAIKAKSMVSFYEMGYKAGVYVLKHARQHDFSVAFFPGPRESGWAADTYHGFLQAIAEKNERRQNIRVFPALYGDTRRDVQQMRLDVLNKTDYHGVDYIVGNAVAAVEAVSYLEKHRDIHPKAQIVATYLTATVYEQIQKGRILAAPSDQIISQSRIALDMMVRILNGERAGDDFPFRVSALIPLITTENVDNYEYEKLFGDRHFQPVYSEFNHFIPTAQPSTR